jgi:hypothetical protein
VLEAHVREGCTPLFEGRMPPEWEKLFEDGERLKVWRRSHPDKKVGQR